MKKFALACLLLGLAASAFAGGGWIADAATKCQVWNPKPEPGETIKWSGQCSNGKATGNGVLQWYLNGKPVERYEGEMLDGKLHGTGTLVGKDGYRYEGDFRNNQIDGKGVQTWTRGDRYEGNWRDGKRDGKGIYTWPNGDRYEGDWRDGKKNGRGIFIWKNGDRYAGDWNNNDLAKSGEAVFIDAAKHGQLKISDEMALKYPDLIRLILGSESVDDAEKQKWIDLLPSMTDEEKERLKNIFLTERRQLDELNENYAKEIKAINEQYLEKTKQAAERGNAQAQFNLGQLYAEGVRAPKNTAEAVKWFRKAAEQGNEDAKKALKEMEK